MRAEATPADGRDCGGRAGVTATASLCLKRGIGRLLQFQPERGVERARPLAEVVS